jgi:hypothetical protein
MNKRLLLVLLGTSIAAGYVGCTTASDRWQKADLSTRNAFLVQQHLLECVSRGETFPVYNLGVKEVELFYDKYPELRDARNEFIRADEELKDVLMRDEEYRANLAWRESQPRRPELSEEYRMRNGPVFARLFQTRPEYRLARDKRDRALYRSNRMTIEQIIQDAAKEGRVLPVEWLGNDKIAEYSARF